MSWCHQVFTASFSIQHTCWSDSSVGLPYISPLSFISIHSFSVFIFFVLLFLSGAYSCFLVSFILAILHWKEFAFFPVCLHHASIRVNFFTVLVCRRPRAFFPSLIITILSSSPPFQSFYISRVEREYGALLHYSRLTQFTNAVLLLFLLPFQNKKSWLGIFTGFWLRVWNRVQSTKLRYLYLGLHYNNVPSWISEDELYLLFSDYSACELHFLGW